MQKLQELADARAQAETSVTETLATELAASENDFETTATRLTEAFAQRRRQLENEFAQAKQNARDLLLQTKARLQQGFSAQQAKSVATYKQSALAIQRKKKESEWQALAVFDAAKDGPQQMLDQAGKRLLARRLQVDGLQRDAITLLVYWAQPKRPNLCSNPSASYRRAKKLRLANPNSGSKPISIACTKGC